MRNTNNNPAYCTCPIEVKQTYGDLPRVCICCWRKFKWVKEKLDDSEPEEVDVSEEQESCDSYGD